MVLVTPVTNVVDGARFRLDCGFSSHVLVACGGIS